MYWPFWTVFGALLMSIPCDSCLLKTFIYLKLFKHFRKNVYKVLQTPGAVDLTRL